jgi:Fe-Mn family superoxide dismutase
MRRRFGYEYDGMRLHEAYFDALKPRGDGALTPDNRFGAMAAREYGSVEKWKADLAGVAKMPGVGWANTYVDPGDGRILNCWVSEHQHGHPVGCRLVLALDVWEHAFSVYRDPTDRAPYIEDFFANVAWGVVASRLT